MAKKTKPAAKTNQTAPYKHPEAKSLMRPEVGTQAQFKKKKPPKTYRYDSSLSPALDWDGQNPAREQGEALIQQVLEAEEPGRGQGGRSQAQGAEQAIPELGRQGGAAVVRRADAAAVRPRAALDQGDHRDAQGAQARQAEDMFELFGDPQHSGHRSGARAYEYQDNWVNRMILGDSLVVMNSLLHYEGLGGQVQMIYMDPPYGVKFGSNFQPFVRKRDVTHNDDEDMTREPEMVQAYRDTWELGLHSYFTYLRDRCLLARDLLTPSGSIFVQISDENLHHVREVMDEVFGRRISAQLFRFVRRPMPLGAEYS